MASVHITICQGCSFVMCTSSSNCVVEGFDSCCASSPTGENGLSNVLCGFMLHVLINSSMASQGLPSVLSLIVSCKPPDYTDACIVLLTESFYYPGQ